MSQHLCTKLNRCSLFSSSLSPSSRCAFVQSGPRLSINAPTFSLIILAAPTEYPLPFLCTLQTLRDHRLATNPLSCSVSILSTSTTSHWPRIAHSLDSNGLTRGTRCHQCRRPLASTQSKTKRLLEHDLKKENEHAARNSPQMSVPHRSQTRREAKYIPTRAQESPQVAISQFDCARSIPARNPRA